MNTKISTKLFFPLLLLFCITFNNNSAAQTKSYLLKGKITDKKTGTGLPGVTIRILNTTKGTISDEGGKYLLNLDKGKYDIQISSIGYNSEDFVLDLNSDIEKNIELKESFVQMSEVLIVAEDPGIGIIRRAIANKRKWMDKLLSYKMTGYTKNTLFKEDSVASINESYSNCFWNKKDGFREKIFQKRQTENIKLNQNFAQVGGIINFNEDVIGLMGYKFTGPTAPDALDNYTYKLLKTYQSRGFNIYELKLIPTSRFRPLFEGTICVSDSIYAITKVELKPNDVFKIPFVKEFDINFTQRFNVFDTIYWMPTDIAIDLKASIKIPGIKLPTISMKQRSILFDFEINKEIPDSVFKKPRSYSDSTVAKLDTVYWSQNRVLPLTQREEIIYKTLDSTKTLEKQFRPEGPLMALASDGEGMGKFLAPLEYADVKFNRIQGWYLGGRYKNSKLFSNQTSIEASLGYGFSDKKWEWEAGITQRSKKFYNSYVYFKYFDKIKNRPDEEYYPDLLNTAFCVFSKTDYNDYYSAKGLEIGGSIRPKDWLRFRLDYLYEDEKSVSNNAGHGFFERKLFRYNPLINPGTLGSVKLEIDLYKSFISNNDNSFISVQVGSEKPVLKLAVEKSADFLGSDFDYTKYSFAAGYEFATFLKSLFLPPYLSFKIRGGMATGKLPYQRLFDLETAAMYFSPFGTFKTMDVKEYAGNSYLEAHVEHNFRSLPFRLCNLTFIEDEGIEFLTFASAGKTWLKTENQMTTSNFINTTKDWYTECGFGFSKIFLFLRLDFSWRLTNKYDKSFFITAQIGNIL
jgi:hypothetical protein